MGDSIRRSMLLFSDSIGTEWHGKWQSHFDSSSALPQLRRWHQQQAAHPCPQTLTYTHTRTHSIIERRECQLPIDVSSSWMEPRFSPPPPGKQSKQPIGSCFDYTQGNRIKSQLIWHLNHGSYSTAAADDTKRKESMKWMWCHLFSSSSMNCFAVVNELCP